MIHKHNFCLTKVKISNFLHNIFCQKGLQRAKKYHLAIIFVNLLKIHKIDKSKIIAFAGRRLDNLKRYVLTPSAYKRVDPPAP